MNLQFRYLCIPDTHMSCALFRFLAFSLTYIHLHTKFLLQTANTSIVRKYVRKKIIRFGYVHPYICIRYVYTVPYASSLNHPSSDINSAAGKERKKEEEEEREVEKKKRKKKRCLLGE